MQSIEGIIDIHSHIIPNVDDGSRSIEETVRLLEHAYGQGIRQIIATPHYIHGHNKMSAASILKQLKTVESAAHHIDPDFEIHQGEELYYYSGIVTDLEEGRALTLGATKYVLVEFNTSITYKELLKAVREFTQACYIPVLAHIERYQCLRKGNGTDELVRMGAYMQMNFSSLSNTHNFLDRCWCRRMVETEKIHLLGTDMHRSDNRPPEIETAARWLIKKKGQDYFEKLTNENPAVLLSGEFI